MLQRSTPSKGVVKVCGSPNYFVAPMPTDPNAPKTIKSVPYEPEAAAIVAALAQKGVRATATGGFLAGFRTEALYICIGI